MPAALWGIIALGILALLLWFYKTCFIFIYCPYCGKGIDVAEGTFKYMKSFPCPWCKRELSKEDFDYKEK